MRTVRSFASEKKECARYEQHLDNILQVSKKKGREAEMLTRYKFPKFSICLCGLHLGMQEGHGVT
jgi:hypothetical protein